MEKNIRNADIIACKLELASTQAINHRLKIVCEKKQKRDGIVEKQKKKFVTT